MINKIIDGIIVKFDSDIVCSENRIIKDIKAIKDHLLEINESDRYFECLYKLEEDSKSKHNRLFIKTNDKCGHGDYIVRFDKFKKGSRCPEFDCKLKRVNKSKEINKRKEIIEFVNNSNYDFFDDDINKSIIQMSEKGYKLRLLCPYCKHLYETMYYNFKAGYGCGCRHGSRAEEKIQSFLESKNFNFVSEKKFDDLVYIEKLRLDFYLPDYNIAIEFDGEQHKKGWNKDPESLKITKIRDQIKDEYCKNNGITLLRFDRKDYKNLEEILGRSISSLIKGSKTM